MMILKKVWGIVNEGKPKTVTHKNKSYRISRNFINDVKDKQI